LLSSLAGSSQCLLVDNEAWILDVGVLQCIQVVAKTVALWFYKVMKEILNVVAVLTKRGHVSALDKMPFTKGKHKEPMELFPVRVLAWKNPSDCSRQNCPLWFDGSDP
jgi:hypothetical protein